MPNSKQEAVQEREGRGKGEEEGSMSAVHAWDMEVTTTESLPAYIQEPSNCDEDLVVVHE